METQEELADLLNREGFQVTQATVSRDIRELKLTKIPVGGGKQKYAVMQSQNSGMNEKYLSVLKDGYLSMDMAQNILVVKTVSGMAMAVAARLRRHAVAGRLPGVLPGMTRLCARSEAWTRH